MPKIRVFTHTVYIGITLVIMHELVVRAWRVSLYTRKNAQLVTSLQTSCYKSVHKLSTSCVRTACSQFVVTGLEQAVNNL
jgi:hypothetical protein